ncbi:MAG: hypothetical protein GXP56_00865 [Deltaproteobacteria bacterium]|nr:hypothetical protein [Deltaproteobacteria bacterium]
MGKANRKIIIWITIAVFGFAVPLAGTVSACSGGGDSGGGNRDGGDDALAAVLGLGGSIDVPGFSGENIEKFARMPGFVSGSNTNIDGDDPGKSTICQYLGKTCQN